MGIKKFSHKCINCGTIRYNYGKKFCSHKCQYEYQKNLQKYQFRKGNKPWNKGLKKSDHPSLQRMGFRMNNKWSYKKGEKVPVERRMAISRALDHGLTKLSIKIRTNIQYSKWRESIFKRDNYTCQICGIKSGCGKKVEFNAHHLVQLSVLIEQNSISNLEEAIKCKNLWSLDNGITLCKSCHEEIHE